MQKNPEDQNPNELLLFRFDGEDSFLEIIQIFKDSGSLQLVFRETLHTGSEVWQITTSKENFVRMAEWIPYMTRAVDLLDLGKR